jgi:putative ABC transport system substrate-binding protein
VGELIRLKVDVIVTTSNPTTRAVKAETTTIPIVMAASSAPVEVGLVASLTRPGGNVTGLSSEFGGEIQEKRLELLKEAVPKISRVAFVGTPAGWESPPGVKVQAAARALGLTLFLAEFQGTDVTTAFPLVTRGRADALFVPISSVTYIQRNRIVEFAATNRLPASYQSRLAVEAGGLMSYSLNEIDLWRRTAAFVDKILKGAKPGDLPIEQPTKFELVINLKTAKALGLTIPPSLLQRADQVIE